jgi:HEAT repeat protein
MRTVASVATADPPAVAHRRERLVECLGDGSAAVGNAAVEALLGAAVPDPVGTTRLLADALADGDEVRCSNAERALRGIAMRNPEPVVDAVAPHLDHADPAVRRSATRMVAAIATHRPARVEGVAAELVAALDDEDDEVVAAAAEAVAAAADERPGAFAGRAPAIAAAIREGEATPELVRALAAVCSVAPDALDPAAVPVDELVDHGAAAVRAGACGFLGAAGGRDALPTLRVLADDPDPGVREAALGAMATLSGRTGAALTAEERERIDEADVGTNVGDGE